MQIIDFLLSPLGVTVLIFGGSAAARLWANVKEKQAQATIAQARREQRREHMRTGKSLEHDQDKDAAPSIQQQAQMSAAPTQGQKAAQADARRARIEALRKQRINQLRAARQQRSNAAPTQQSPSRPMQQAPAPQAQSRSPRQPFQQNPAAPSRPALSRPAQSMPQPTQMPVAPRRRVSQEPAAAPLESGAPRSPRRIAAESAPKPKAPKVEPVLGIREQFRSPGALRRAIIAAEVLGPPVAMRPPRGSHLAD